MLELSLLPVFLLAYILTAPERELRSVETCEMRIQRAATLGGDRRGIIGYPMTVARDHSGRYFVVGTGMQSSVQVFNSSGAFLASLGRTGRGPNEFLSAHLIHDWPGDSIAVWDWGNRRIQLYPPSLRDPQILKASAVPARRAVVLRDGTIVLNGHRADADHAGLYLHRVSRDGRIIASFDGTNSYRFDQPYTGRRALTTAGKGGFWSASQTDYRLLRWSPEGKVVQELRRMVAWLPPGGRFGLDPKHLDRPPGPGLIDITEDSDGRLWTLFLVADRNWKMGLGTRTTGGRNGIAITDESRFWDTIVDVIDDRGKPIASARFDIAMLGWLGDGFGYSYRERDDSPRIDVWTLNLHCQPETRSQR